MTRFLRIFSKMGLGRFYRQTAGAALVELTITIPLFLLLFFGLVDFGRLAYRYVASEKAMQFAGRLAAVRPPACAGVPLLNELSQAATNPAPKLGTSCSSGTSICAVPAAVTCSGANSNGTANEIWTQINTLLPAETSIENLSFSYTYDARMGFLGGPYIPMVTVSLVDAEFAYATPLAGLAALASASQSGLSTTAFPFPTLSVSLPSEDLNQGDNG